MAQGRSYFRLFNVYWVALVRIACSSIWVVMEGLSNAAGTFFKIPGFLTGFFQYPMN
jgi:hypothetical protein